MDLLEYRDGKVFPSLEALTMEPFKTMYAEDDTPGKGEVINDLTYVHLMLSPKKSNVFNGYLNLETRDKKVREEVWKSPYYPLSKWIGPAMLKYEECLQNASPSFAILQTSLKIAANLKNFLETVDLDARTNSGAAVYKPKDISSALKDIPEIIKNLEVASNNVNAELKESAKNKANRDIGHFER